MITCREFITKVANKQGGKIDFDEWTFEVKRVSDYKMTSINYND